MRQVDTRRLALTAALAAIYTIFRLIPLSKLIGISGFITASGMVIPIIALLIEPEYGVLAVITGTFIGSFSPLNSLRFAGLDFMPGAIYLLIASLAVRGKIYQAGTVLLAVVALFSITPNTRIFVGAFASPPLPYFWLHLVALGLLVSPLSRNIPKWLQSKNYARVAASVGIVGFAGTMAEHLSGGILFALFVGPGAVKLWPGIYLVYPVERALIVAGAILVCTPFVLNSLALRERILGRTQKLWRDQSQIGQ